MLRRLSALSQLSSCVSCRLGWTYTKQKVGSECVYGCCSGPYTCGLAFAKLTELSGCNLKSTNGRWNLTSLDDGVLLKCPALGSPYDLVNIKVISCCCCFLTHATVAELCSPAYGPVICTASGVPVQVNHYTRGKHMWLHSKPSGEQPLHGPAAVLPVLVKDQKG